ncbi:MAG: hypothetical protein KQJ78_14705 [Deltaproteobacteria bacterium]|nr:hypothetical protein [Deltaproteobacteria bacterium]
MNKRETGPPGLADWEQAFPALFAVHGGPVTLAAALGDAPAPVRELVDLVEAHPLELFRTGEGAVSIREADKEAAARVLPVVERAIDLVTGHQEEVRAWLGSLIA